MGLSLKNLQSQLLSPTALAYLALFSGLFGLGMSAIFVRFAEAPGAVNGFYRMLTAVVIFAIPLNAQVRRHPITSKRAAWFALAAGACFAGDLAFWNTAVFMTSAANATFLANTAPLWVGLGSVVFFHQRLRPLFWIGLMISLSGAAILLNSDFHAGREVIIGSLLSLGAGFFYAGFFLTTEQARNGLNTFVSWWLAALGSMGCLLVIALALRQPFFGYPWPTYAWIFCGALVTQVGGYMFVNFALGHLPATIVSSTLLLQPVVTAIAAILLLHEPLCLFQIFGGFFVISGVWIVNRYGR
ncbi:hypothetical protein U14_04994 [Candidatus Moduliflexus flocculans]|uniref:EamA domain-containing protein n=1 Tax=Candidatus Moduliflexus flocculans TaxID=1499966 RepID=A0A081BQN9_9BACT|nr:hypothetical protein U14_04994 [Candidatus Moduliflexus flocculans]